MNNLFKERIIYTAMNDGSINKYVEGIREQFDYCNDPNTSAFGLEVKELSDDKINFFNTIGFMDEGCLVKDKDLDF